MGRLFDTVAALIGIRQQVNYEAQAAIELEAIIDPDETDHYSFDVDGNIISLKGILESLISDIRKCVAKPILAAKFHNAITNMVREVCMKIKDETGCSTVALSGGVWQNLFLLEKTANILEKNSFNVLFHQNVPSNDGGISLGQALIAATKIRDPKIKKSERM
jgi:hydrogenase maturation protein HypF